LGSYTLVRKTYKYLSLNVFVHAEISESLEKSIDQFYRKASKLEGIIFGCFIVGFFFLLTFLPYSILYLSFLLFLYLLFPAKIQLSWKYSEKLLIFTDVNIDYIKAASHVLQTFEKRLERFPEAILTHRDLNGNKLEVKMDLVKKSREVYGELLIDAEFCLPEDPIRGILVKATYTGNTQLSSYKDAAGSYRKLCTEFRSCVFEEITHEAQREEIGKLKEWIESEINKVRAFLRELGSPVRIFI
jgi:hypothetical protein